MADGASIGSHSFEVPASGCLGCNFVDLFLTPELLTRYATRSPCTWASRRCGVKMMNFSVVWLQSAQHQLGRCSLNNAPCDTLLGRVAWAF